MRRGRLTAIQTTMDRCETSFGAPPSAATTAPPPLREVLATAHSLACVHGELVGDPVDTKLVTFSEWVRILRAPPSGLQSRFSYTAFFPHVRFPRSYPPTLRSSDAGL